MQQVCKSCRTCFKFYCMFYFTCDHSFSPAYKAGSLRTPGLPGTKPTYRPLPHKCETHITSVYRQRHIEERFMSRLVNSKCFFLLVINSDAELTDSRYVHRRRMKSLPVQKPFAHKHSQEFAGGLSPNSHGALPPNLMSTPPPVFCHPPPQTIFGHFICTILCNLCMLSVNCVSWQSGIMTPKNEKYINWVGKAHCMLAFFKWRIKRNRASVATSERENFGENDRKSIFYKANTCLSNVIFLHFIPQLL